MSDQGSNLPFLGEGDRNYALWLELQKYVGASEWITPVLASPWVASPVIRYRRVNGVVYMQGVITTLGTNGVTIFTLPENMRPSINSRLVGHTGSSTNPATINVNTDGTVNVFLSAGTTVSFANAAFPVIP